jgi:hypothetical protein
VLESTAASHRTHPATIDDAFAVRNRVRDPFPNRRPDDPKRRLMIVGPPAAPSVKWVHILGVNGRAHAGQWPFARRDCIRLAPTKPNALGIPGAIAKSSI